MNRTSILLSVLLGGVVVAPAAAQDQDTTTRRIEIGVRGGITGFENEGSWVRYTAFPGGGFPAMGTAYVTFFTGGRTAVEPYFGFSRVGTSNGHSTQLALGGQVMQFSSPDPETESTYGFVNGGMIGGFSSGSSGASYQLGGGFGYRMVIRESLGVRVEARYRRWFDEDSFGLNEVSLGIGLGALLGTGRP